MVERFKHTEIGIIPKDWKVKKVGECLLRNPDYGINAAAVPYNENLPVYLRITDITEEGNYSKKNLVSVNNISSSSYFLEEGDLVFARTGASVGKTYLYNPKDGKLVFAGFLIRVRVNEEVILPNYLKYFTQTKQYWDWIAGNSLRTGQPGINGNEYKELQIPLPPTKAEQTTIATALNDVDALIQKLKELVAKKQDIKTGAMQELLRPKKNWEEKTLGEIATLKARIGWQGLTTAEYKKTGDYFLITGTEFKNGFIDWANCVYVDESRYKQDKNIQIKEHDVLVTKDGTIGKVALIKSVPKPATLNSGVFVIRPIDNSFHPEFFYYLLLSEVFAIFLSQLSAGSTINHLYQKDFVTFKFLQPKTIEEQMRIAQILSDIDSEIQELELQLEKYKMIRQGMIQSLLTGKIRLV